jgi:hypothetical protein
VIYGGYLVDEETGQAVYWHEPSSAKQWVEHLGRFVGTALYAECYFFTIEKDAYKDLSWLKGKDWQGVASYVGLDVLELIRMARSEDITERARVYEDVGNYFGFINLDGDGPEHIHCITLGAMYPK